MPATINGGGDVLARGGVRATFRGPNVSQEKWDAIWGKDSGPKKNYSEQPTENPAVEEPKEQV